MTDWQRIEAPASQGLAQAPADLRSQQSRKDMLYRRRKVFSGPG
jgi:hypothetical protein